MSLIESTFTAVRHRRIRSKGCLLNLSTRFKESLAPAKAGLNQYIRLPNRKPLLGPIKTIARARDSRASRLRPCAPTREDFCSRPANQQRALVAMESGRMGRCVALKTHPLELARDHKDLLFGRAGRVIVRYSYSPFAYGDFGRGPCASAHSAAKKLPLNRRVRRP